MRQIKWKRERMRDQQASESGGQGPAGLVAMSALRLTCSTGAIQPLPQGPAVRPDPVPRSPCFAFSQGFCCKDASRTRTARWAPPWISRGYFTSKGRYYICITFALKFFFLNKTYICCLFTYLRDCVVGFSPWREFTVSKGAGWSQSAVWRNQTIKTWWATFLKGAALRFLKRKLRDPSSSPGRGPCAMVSGESSLCLLPFLMFPGIFLKQSKVGT